LSYIGKLKVIIPAFGWFVKDGSKQKNEVEGIANLLDRFAFISYKEPLGTCKQLSNLYAFYPPAAGVA